MKKYDRIFIDAETNNTGRPTIEDLFEEIQGPVIVMSISELVLLWKASEDHAVESERKSAFDKLKTPDFKAYLQSKGINIYEPRQ